MATSSSSVRQRLASASHSMLSVFSLSDDDSKKERAFVTPAESASAAASSSAAEVDQRSARLVILLFCTSITLVFFSQLLSSRFSTYIPNDLAHGGEPYSNRLANYPRVLVRDSPDFNAKTDKKPTSTNKLTEEIASVNRTFGPGAPHDGDAAGRLIVLTMNRDNALQRLLKSAQVADYGDDRVDIDIWIDRKTGQPPDAATLKVANDFVWTHGAKTVHLRHKNGGLYQQWIYTWNVPEQTDEIAVILEDDLELSPAFYQWLKISRQTYGSDPEVAAFTLQRSVLRPKPHPISHSTMLDLPQEIPVFKYRLLGSWGFSPQRDAWVEFRKWFEEKRAQGEKPYVDGLITTQWYKSQEVNGYAPTMWTQWWIRFAHEKGYFTVTPHLKDGTTLCANHRENGMHYSNKKLGQDFPIFRGSVDSFTWPVTPVKVDWDGRIILQQ